MSVFALGATLNSFTTGLALVTIVNIDNFTTFAMILFVCVFDPTVLANVAFLLFVGVGRPVELSYIGIASVASIKGLAGTAILKFASTCYTLFSASRRS